MREFNCVLLTIFRKRRALLSFLPGWLVMVVDLDLCLGLFDTAVGMNWFLFLKPNAQLRRPILPLCKQ